MTTLLPNDTDLYIANSAKEAQEKLKEIRAAIIEEAPGATERTDYFQLPGYSYEGYDYDGLFAWFSYKKPSVRLHLRPPVIQEHKKELAGYLTTKAIVSFPIDQKMPIELIKKLVKASLKVMKAKKVLMTKKPKLISGQKRKKTTNRLNSGFKKWRLTSKLKVCATNLLL